jgi:hypothetical protein
MVIALLASLTPLLLTRGCQHDPSFLGDFLRVGLPLRPAKSPKGLRRMPTLCGVSYGQLAKVEKKVNSWKSVCRIPDKLDPRSRDFGSKPRPYCVACHDILEACVKMCFFGCSTADYERRLGAHSLGIKDAESLPTSASHSRMPSVKVPT